MTRAKLPGPVEASQRRLRPLQYDERCKVHSNFIRSGSILDSRFQNICIRQRAFFKQFQNNIFSGAGTRHPVDHGHRHPRRGHVLDIRDLAFVPRPAL